MIDKNNFNPSYIGRRADILMLVPEGVTSVLDIGCSIGELGYGIKKKFGAEVVGVEISKEMAKVAAEKLDKVITGNIEDERVLKKLAGKRFDVVIMGDLLEHLNDPWTLVKKISLNLKSNGIIIASIPNVRHVDTIANLLVNGYWPYRTRGIHDKTHLRFFTKRNIEEMFNDAGFRPVIALVHYRFIDKIHSVNMLAKYFAIPVLKDFLAFQYLIVAHKI